MNKSENKIIIKIGSGFEANATGTVSVLLLFAIVVTLAAVGYSFV